MISEYPKFSQLELSDKNEIQMLTQGFFQYSDFSFSNLWSWDISLSKRSYAKLNGNLIIKLHDYKTNEPFFSICGSNLQNETISRLLETGQETKSIVNLKLIPEEFIQKLTLPQVSIIEDRDNFDYIYSVEELKAFEGGKFKQKRNEVNALLTAYPEIEARELDIKNLAIKKEISCLFHQWTKRKIAKEGEFEFNENNAFSNLLILSENYDLILVGLYLRDRLVAFIISEARNSEYAVGHFAKTDTSIRGINAYLLQSLAKVLAEKDIKYFNYEQDLGLKNLRDAKMRFRPAFFLKKYSLIAPSF